MEEIYFSEFITSKSSKLLLFELPQDLLQELDHSTLHINGTSSDDAILCGSSSSYLLKKCETSNSLLLLEKNKVIKTAHEIFSCEKTIPPLHQILNLLEESPYTYKDQSNF
jgi:Uncharacterized conserved protein (DUF2036).